MPGRKTNNVFEFSAKSVIGLTYFSSCDKKQKLFCYPLILGWYLDTILQARRKSLFPTILFTHNALYHSIWFVAM